jgi:hypothetical protein
MRKLLAVVACGVGIWAFSACGSSGDGSGSISDPVEACKEGSKIICDKIFACFTKEELEDAKMVVGLNAADCAERQNADCTPDKKNCKAGETFHADKAQSCLDGIRSYNCDDIKDPNTPDPAACAVVCTK